MIRKLEDISFFANIQAFSKNGTASIPQNRYNKGTNEPLLEERTDFALDYNDDIQRSIEYIETNLTRELTAIEIAEHIGYSVYHFCRVFSVHQGMPLMDFVRKKRLIQARRALLTNRKIIDIALEYSFETASGFSKAFRKEFGYSPTVYLAKFKAWHSSNLFIHLEGDRMQPTFVTKSGFKVAGYGIYTNLANGYTKDIAAYWDTYIGDNLESKMYAQLTPPEHGEVGICIPASEEGNIVYLFGVIVDDYSKVTPDMITVEVPEAHYAIFTTPPVDYFRSEAAYEADPLAAAVQATWTYIFEEWFPNSEYVYDESKLDFEFYDERCHGHRNVVMDIYVPVQKSTAQGE
ncbi:AraC family transcriptional regulator [Paenibacillaceae sp. P-4]|uniref:AraC family transcriptional regulator n=1 Tax=Paenibacillaceae bacterium P-4 TaxID=3160969 RepID=UPI0032E842F6